MPLSPARRELRAHSARMDATADGRTLTGYAAVFESPSEISEWGFRFTEVVKPGAFARTLASGQDVLCCLNHSAMMLLGRSVSKTAKFWEDSVGLRFEVQLPDTPTGNEVRELVKRGDLAGASFSFSVPGGGERWPSPNFRELVDVDLWEAGPVVTPAYSQTSLDIRAGGHQGERRRHPLDELAALRQRLNLHAKR